eukprot:CAMPEP_0117429458 /NCGR_PEP_ID=MMETSP0758-20121206/9020_1 /TAXON_ID=63605 /ORGANISM="Percolomonas cosmopolitus, Strain AE-1 (ATCC 50343)" /LENGTH=362 /DNA_ID=CAMNT_0005216543 /DNA_START=124 /DNA_END=1212 /DNA_ORIENTATION=+
MAGYLLPVLLDKDITTEKQSEELIDLFTENMQSGSLNVMNGKGSTMFVGTENETVLTVNHRENKVQGIIYISEGHGIDHLEAVSPTEFIVGTGKHVLLIRTVASEHEGYRILWKKEVTIAPYARINAVAVHPTGRIVLAISDDNRFKAFNMLSGQEIGTLKFPSEPTHMAFSKSGDFFAITFKDQINTYSTETFEIVKSIPAKSTPRRVIFAEDFQLVVGHQDGSVFIHDLITPENLIQLDMHTTRIKELCNLEINYMEHLIGIISGDGHISVIRMNGDAVIIEAEHQVDARVQSISLNPVTKLSSRIKSQKRYYDKQIALLESGELEEEPLNEKRKRDEKDIPEDVKEMEPPKKKKKKKKA